MEISRERGLSLTILTEAYTRSVYNVAFCVLIEDVNSGHIECNVDDVACSCCGAVGYTSDHVGFFGYQVQVNLGTHKLGNFNVCFDYGVGHCSKGSSVVMDTFGTDTQNNFLTNIFLQCGIFCLFLGQLQGVGAECYIQIVALLLENCEKIYIKKKGSAVYR